MGAIFCNRRGTHKSLQRVFRSSLLTAGELFANRQSVWGFQPSFDGQLLAWWGIRWGRATVFVGRLESSGRLKVLATLKGRNDHFSWQSYGPMLSVVSAQRLWLVDPFRPTRPNWTDITPRGFQGWNIVHEARTISDRHIVASADRNPALPDIYSVRTDGGGKELIARNEGETRSWALDSNGWPAVRIDRSSDEGSVHLSRDDSEGGWREFARTGPEDILTVWHTDDPEAPLEGLSNRSRDKVALVSIAPGTGKEFVLLENPNVDILDVFQFSRGSRTDLAIIRDGYPSYVGLSERGKRFVKLLGSQDTPVHAELLGFSRDGRFVSVAASRQGFPFTFWLFDLHDEHATLLARSPLIRRTNSFCETRPVNFAARDGRIIPAFLTLPNEVRNKRLSAIVLVHGGPASHDMWAYDLDKQFLSSRGYAILSVNYRGSTGYGREFQSAGYGEYGRAMQDDVVDAARWLVAEGIADERSIGIMGGSYGGYAAALATTRDSGLFAAAVVEYGMLDVKYQMQNNPFAWGLYLGQMTRYFGDPEREEDLALMVERSPLTHVALAKAPILITAGKLDRTVGFEQSEEFERALKAAGKPVEAVYFANEGHGYAQWQTKILRARVLERFFARTLGGRVQGASVIEIVAKYWR